MSQPSPLSATRLRAQSLTDAGDPAKAVALLEHAIELGRTNLGEDDPDVLTTTRQLAVVLRQSGDAGGARRVLEEAFAAGQWRHGDSDPLMLSISYELGLVAEEMENRHEARRAFGRVAAHGPAALGGDHWMVTQARAYLGEDPPTVRIELPSPLPRTVPPAPPAPATPPPAPAATPHFAQRSAPPASGPPYFGQPSAPPAPAQSRPHEQAPPAPAPGWQHEQAPGWHNEPAQSWHNEPAPAQTWQHEQTWQPEPAPAWQPPPQQIAHAPGVPLHGQRPPPEPAPGRSGFGVRAPALFAAIAAVLGVAIAVVALVVVLAGKGDADGESDVPILSGPAPTDVRIKDYGASVQLFWSDPANGRASFIITGAQSGSQLRSMGEVGPATTTFPLNGLNENLDYCFAVVAVYSSSEFSTSPQICTSREQAGTGSRPGN